MAKAKPHRDLVTSEYNGADIAPYTDAPPKANKADRVNYIADLMASGRYRSRMTIRALMRVWAIGEESLLKESAEASRRLATPPEDLDALRSELASTVKHILYQAMTTPSKITGLPDYASALKATELYGRYSGAELKLTVEEKANRVPMEVKLIYANPPPEGEKGPPKEPSKA
jgi:hypothetical protein